MRILWCYKFVESLCTTMGFSLISSTPCHLSNFPTLIVGSVLVDFHWFWRFWLEQAGGANRTVSFLESIISIKKSCLWSIVFKVLAKPKKTKNHQKQNLTKNRRSRRKPQIFPTNPLKVLEIRAIFTVIHRLPRRIDPTRPDERMVLTNIYYFRHFCHKFYWNFPLHCKFWIEFAEFVICVLVDFKRGDRDQVKEEWIPSSCHSGGSERGKRVFRAPMCPTWCNYYHS